MWNHHRVFTVERAQISTFHPVVSRAVLSIVRKMGKIWRFTHLRSKLELHTTLQYNIIIKLKKN